MSRAPSPKTRQPVRPSTPAAKPAGSGAAAGVVKLLVFAGVIGGAGWLGYGEWKKRRVAEVPEEAPKAAVREAIPEVKREDIPDTRAEAKPDVAPKPEKVVEETKPVVEALQALPPLHRPEAVVALRDATLARMKDGRWEEHLKIVKAAARAAIDERARTGGPGMLDKLTDRTALPLGLAHIVILERLKSSEIADLTKEQGEFFTEVLTSGELAELFAANLLEDDHPAAALRVWAILDAREKVPADRLHYRNLALSLALIHDKPNGEARAGEVYDYYRDADKRHKLYADFDKIRPDELVWGVGDHAFGLDDQRWALKNVNFPFAQLGKAYPSIAYRMNHAPYPEYTMENVFRMGGICMNQSQYAVGNARARGVPSAYVAGEGSRGGHAWFAFRGPQGWVHDVGRYSDGYACGMATNPQTGKPFREWDFALYNDPARRNGDYDAALRLARAAAVLTEAGDKEGGLNLLDAAVARDNGNPTFWRLRVDALVATDKGRPVDFWEKLVNDYRIALRESPDWFVVSDRIETEKIFPKMDPDRVGEMLRKRRRQSIRENPSRFDLLNDSIRREASYYQSRKDDTRVGLLYNASLREYGKNLPTFVLLAEDFAKLAVEIPSIRKSGLSTLESVFNKDVDSKLKGDTFALAMQAKVAGKVAGIFEADGDAKKAEKYAERARVIGDKANAERTAMR